MSDPIVIVLTPAELDALRLAVDRYARMLGHPAAVAAPLRAVVEKVRAAAEDPRACVEVFG